MNDYKKITVPANVANAIAHYVALADTKTEAFTDILRFGYEAANSVIILRHFEHDYDELMEALICGYEVEKTPEEEIRDYYTELKQIRERLSAADDFDRARINRYHAVSVGITFTLNRLGIKITGVND